MKYTKFMALAGLAAVIVWVFQDIKRFRNEPPLPLEPPGGAGWFFPSLFETEETI